MAGAATIVVELVKPLGKGRGGYPRHTRAKVLEVTASGDVRATFWDGRTIRLWADEYRVTAATP